MSTGIDVNSRTYAMPASGCLYMLLGPILIAAPFVCDKSVEWWVYVLSILGGLIAFGVGRTRFKGVCVDPRNDSITYGSKSVKISEVELVDFDWKTTYGKDGDSHTKYWVLVGGAFGQWKIPVSSKEKGRAMEAFISEVRRRMK